MNPSPAAADAPSDRQWYLLRCKPREDRRAVLHLGNQGFESFAPDCVVVKRGPAGIRRLTEPLFPGYVFVHLSRTSDDWSVLRSTRGVRCLVTFGSHAPSVPEEVIDQLRRLDGEELAAPWAGLRPGDAVQVLGGPFGGLQGVFEQRDGELRAYVLLQYMQRQVRVQLPVEGLRKAG